MIIGRVARTPLADAADRANAWLALQPANIAVQPSLDDVGTRDGMRLVRAQISVENKGARAFVIHAPYAVRAHKLKSAPTGRFTSRPDGQLWDGSLLVRARRAECQELHRRGSEGAFDTIEMYAAVRHCKTEDDAGGVQPMEARRRLEARCDRHE
ncbi:MAG TPA: hypothetical protein VJ276_15415 [Thermoanaerobaculia bacterium]|nr:hypothetical protein [Thermoanaerobaculia bacterium]